MKKLKKFCDPRLDDESDYSETECDPSDDQGLGKRVKHYSSSRSTNSNEFSENSSQQQIHYSQNILCFSEDASEDDESKEVQLPTDLFDRILYELLVQSKIDMYTILHMDEPNRNLIISIIYAQLSEKGSQVFKAALEIETMNYIVLEFEDFVKLEMAFKHKNKKLEPKRYEQSHKKMISSLFRTQVFRRLYKKLVCFVQSKDDRLFLEKIEKEVVNLGYVNTGKIMADRFKSICFEYFAGRKPVEGEIDFLTNYSHGVTGRWIAEADQYKKLMNIVLNRIGTKGFEDEFFRMEIELIKSFVKSDKFKQAKPFYNRYMFQESRFRLLSLFKLHFIKIENIPNKKLLADFDNWMTTSRSKKYARKFRSVSLLRVSDDSNSESQKNEVIQIPEEFANNLREQYSKYYTVTFDKEQ